MMSSVAEIFNRVNMMQLFKQKLGPNLNLGRVFFGAFIQSEVKPKALGQLIRNLLRNCDLM